MLATLTANIREHALLFRKTSIVIVNSDVIIGIFYDIQGNQTLAMDWTLY